MFLIGIWHGGLSDEEVEDIANSNLYVMRFLDLYLEDDVLDHSVLSRFRTRLTKAAAWGWIVGTNHQQIQQHNVTVTSGYHIARVLHTVRASRRTSRPMKW